MSVPITRTYDEAGLVRLAELLVCLSRPGDCITLHGDLGAGKSTFARAFVRASLGDDAAEVPSPTFSIQQSYRAARFDIVHADLYRLTSSEEAEETGLVEAMDRSVSLIEWPDRAASLLPAERIEVHLDGGASEALRSVKVIGLGQAAARAQRLIEIDTFLDAIPQLQTLYRIQYMQGDASTRAYARLIAPSVSFVLMDAPRQSDGPVLEGGRTYSQIAQLAEDVRPFVAVGQALVARGLSAPAVVAADLGKGLLLLEDLGTRVYGDEIRGGTDQQVLTAAAVDALLHLRRTGLPSPMLLPDGTAYTLPRRDRAAFEIEIDLLLDWYWPSVKPEPLTAEIRAEFRSLWTPVIDRLLALPKGVFLRDFHSPNLLWLPDRTPPVRRVGIIDFQDALAEHWSFDLVSLLQDARVDVTRQIEAEELDYYCARAAEQEPGFDAPAFRAAYADFGAQRNTRLIGLWARLLRRDGKANYLQHLPRTWDYLERNLAHPRLTGVKSWFDHHFPLDVRKSVPKA
jgi:N-acetylmuramate 1-kinase